MDTNMRKRYEKDMRANNHFGKVEAKRMLSKIKEARVNGTDEISIPIDSAECISLLLMYYCDSNLFDDAYCDFLNGIDERVDEMLEDVRTACGIVK